MRRLLPWLAGLIGGPLLLLAVLFVFRQALLDAWVKQGLVSEIGSQLGLEVAIEAVGGSYLGGLELAGVRTIGGSPKTPLTSINIGRLDLHYSLPALLGGLDAFVGQMRLGLEGGHIQINIQPGGEGPATTAKEGEAPGFALPARLPEIKVADFEVKLQIGEGQAAFSGLAMAVAPVGSGDAQAVAIEVAQALVPWPGFNHDPHRVGLRLNYSPPSARVDEFSIDGVALSRSMLFQLQETVPGRPVFTAAGDLELFAGRSHLETTIAPGLISAKLSLELCDLDAFPAFLQRPQMGATGQAAGRIEFSLDPDQPAGLTGNAELKIDRARLGEVAIRQAELRAGVKDGRLLLQRLAIELDSGSITVADADLALAPVLDNDIPAGANGATGSFSVDFADALPILGLAGLQTKTPGRPPAPLAIHGSGGIGHGIFTVQTLEAGLGNNRLQLEKVTMPLPAVLASPDYYRLLTATAAGFVVEAKDLPLLFALTGQDLPPTLQQTWAKPHQIALAGQLLAGRVDVSRGVLHAAGADIVLDQGQLTLATPAFSLEKTTVQAGLALAVPDLAAISGLFALPVATQGEVNGSLKLSGSLAAVDGTLELNSRQLVLGRVRLDALAVRARARDGLITVDSLKAEAGPDRLAGRGTYEIASRCFADLNLQLSVMRLESYLGEAVPENLRLAGRLQAHLEAAGKWAEPEARLTFSLADGRYRTVAIHEAAVQLTNSGRLLGIEQARLDTAQGLLAFSGVLERDPADRLFTCNLASLAAKRGGLEMALAAPARLTLDRAGNLTTDRLLLAGNGGSIEASGSLRPAGNSDLRLRFSNLTGQGWLEGLIGDRLYFQGASGLITIAGPLGAPAITAAGTVAEIGGSDAPFPFSGAFDFTLASQEVVIRTFSFIGKGGQSTIEASGRLPFDPFTGEPHADGELALACRSTLPELKSISSLLPADWAASSGSLRSELSLQGTMAKPRGRLALAGSQVVLPATIRFLPPGPLELNAELLADEDRLAISRLRVSGRTMTIEASGQWLAPPTLSQLLAGKVYPLSGTLDLTASLVASDLSWAARDSGAIRRLSGALEIKGSLTGPAASPLASGTIHLADGELRPGYATPSLRAVNLDADIDARAVTIKNLHGELGGAPFSITGVVREFASASPELELALKGENLLLFRSEGLRLRSDVDLLVKGPLAQLTVSGELAITDGRFSRAFDFLSPLRGTSRPKAKNGLVLFSIHEPPFNRAVFNVRVLAREPFRIKNNLAEGSIRPDLLLTGTGEVPVLVGSAYLDPSSIKLPTGRLAIDSGLVRFPETDPDRPQLDMTGKASLMDYDVTVTFHGPIDEPIITLSSSPPLADDQLLLLVLTGKPPETGGATSASAGGVARQGGMKVAVYLGRSILSKWFSSSSTESEESILDRFEVEIGRGVTRLGDETIDAKFRLATGIFRDDDILFITAEKDIYDAFNSGVKLVFQFR